MDFVVDILIEAIFDIFGEIFAYLGKSFFPDGVSERTRKVINVISAIIGAIFLLLLLLGIFMVVQSSAKSMPGWVFLTLGVIYIAVGIILKLIRIK